MAADVIAPPQPVAETKFLFPSIYRLRLQAFLERILVRDRNYPFSAVSTVYYDTPSLRAYRETKRRVRQRSKARLRWYEDVRREDPERLVPCFLEVKRKEGAVRFKRRERHSVRAARLGSSPLLDPKVMALAHRASGLMPMPGEAIVPMLEMRYERFRFVDPSTGARISLDYGIRCLAGRPGLLPARRTVELRPCVLEIKGRRGALPGSLAPVREFLRRRSFSKYARCCDRLLRSGGLEVR